MSQIQAAPGPYPELDDSADARRLMQRGDYVDYVARKSHRKKMAQVAMAVVLVAGIAYFAWRNKHHITHAVNTVGNGLRSTEEQVVGATLETAIDF